MNPVITHRDDFEANDAMVEARENDAVKILDEELAEIARQHYFAYDLAMAMCLARFPGSKPEDFEDDGKDFG